MAALALATIGLGTATAPAPAGDMQVIRTHNVRGVVITLLSTAGEWTAGENRFVIELMARPASRQRLMLRWSIVAMLGLALVASACQRSAPEVVLYTSEDQVFSEPTRRPTCSGPMSPCEP